MNRNFCTSNKSRLYLTKPDGLTFPYFFLVQLRILCHSPWDSAELYTREMILIGVFIAMKHDWETKRYTFEDLKSKDTETNEHSYHENWVEYLILKSNWDAIEIILTKKERPLLLKSQILLIQNHLKSSTHADIETAFEEMRKIILDIIFYLFENLKLENESNQDLKFTTRIQEINEILNILDILAVIPPEIRTYLKILLKNQATISDSIQNLLTERYTELFCITLVWLFENSIKNTLPVAVQLMDAHLFDSSFTPITFLQKESPIVLDVDKTIFKEPVFMRKEGIKQVDIEAGLVFQHPTVESLAKKILKPLTTPINKIFMLVGAKSCGKTCFIRNLMRIYEGDSFYISFSSSHSIHPPNWKQIYNSLIAQNAKYIYSRIAPLFVFDELHHIKDYDGLWDDLILPILKNTKFNGRIIFSHRNASNFHAKTLDTYRGKLKSHINAIFLNNTICIQRDVQYVAEFLSLFLRNKKNYAYASLAIQDHNLHQLLYQLSDSLNLSILRNFLFSINWEEYPELYEDKLQNWLHEFALQELGLSNTTDMESDSDLEAQHYRITLLFLISLTSMLEKHVTLSDFYQIVYSDQKTDNIFINLLELEIQGWLKREVYLNGIPTFHYQFHSQTDAQRIFSTLSSEFGRIQNTLKFSFTLKNPEDLFKFEWIGPYEFLPTTFKWEEFGIFKAAPLLKLEPLHDEQQLEKYFVTPNIQEKIFDIGRLFGDRILLLGDYKIGKTSLKNRIIHLLKKDLDILHLTINVTKIKEIRGNDISESVSRNIYKQWYKQLYQTYFSKDYRDDPRPFKYGDSEEYLDRLLELYKRIFTEHPQKFSMIVFEANQLEMEHEVLPFKIFAEIFQVVWENDFSEFLRSKIFILCIGNRSWISYFNIDQTKRFGVFPNWLLFEDWDLPKLQIMLEKRIQYALLPQFNHLIPKLIPQNLINNLYDINGKQISGWLQTFKEFLVEFGKDFDYFRRDITRFNRFLDLKHFSREEYTKLVDKHKIITLCNDLLKFRAKTNAAIFKDVIDIIGYVYTEKSVSLENFSKHLTNPMYTVTEELILKRLTVDDDEKPQPLPFRIKNNRIRLKETLTKFLEEIERRTNLKEPHEILLKYLGREIVSKKKEDTNIEFINEASNILSNIANFAREKENLELEQFIRDMIDTQIEQISVKLEVLTNLSKAEDKNSVMIDIKHLIAECVELTSEIPVILFDLSDENIPDTFNNFVKKIWDPSDNYNWKWIQAIDSNSPVDFNETVRQFHKFCFNFDVALSNFDQLDSYQKSSIISELIKDVMVEAPIVFREAVSVFQPETSSGVLWAVDGPNVHYLDIFQAEKHIRDHILQENEQFDKIVCLKNSYRLPHNFYYSIYKRYQEVGFNIKFPDGGDKEEDVDEYFTYLMNNQFITHKYRVLIVGSVDKLAIRFLSQKLQEYPDIEVYIFGDGVSKLSWKKFDEYIGKDKLMEMYREFSLKHRKLGENTYYGTVDIYPEKKPKLEEGKLYVSYAENGRDLKFKVDRHFPLPMEVGEFFSENRTYQVIFTPTSNNYVHLLQCAPIDERLLYEGYFWAIAEHKEFLNDVDTDEFLKKNDFPFLIDLKNYLRDAINRRLLFDLLSKKFRDYVETHGIEIPTLEVVDKFLDMFPLKLFPEVVMEYTDDFKEDLKRIKPNKKKKELDPDSKMFEE